MSTSTAYIVLNEPSTIEAAECSKCGFDSVLAFPLTLVDECGVGPFGTYKACSRCWGEPK